MVYTIYAFMALAFIFLIKIDYIFVKLKIFKRFAAKAATPQIARDISLGMFVNATFGMLTATSGYMLVGYSILTIISLTGIIVAESKINK